jgi:hypothetical protein
MEFLYVLVYGSEWEDIVILNLNEDPIKESIKHPKVRVEIFSKTDSGYRPIYNYYKNGHLYKY